LKALDEIEVSLVKQYQNSINHQI